MRRWLIWFGISLGTRRGAHRRDDQAGAWFELASSRDPVCFADRFDADVVTLGDFAEGMPGGDHMGASRPGWGHEQDQYTENSRDEQESGLPCVSKRKHCVFVQKSDQTAATA